MSSAEAPAPPIGQRVREVRLALGMTQAELGAAIGQAERTVQAWELGDRLPRMPALRRLAAIAEKPVSYFFTEAAA